MDNKAIADWIHRRKGKYGTWAAFAKEIEVPVASLQAAATNQRPPTPQMLKALGIRREVEYRITRKVAK